jgi:hypothetical protein
MIRASFRNLILSILLFLTLTEELRASEIHCNIERATAQVLQNRGELATISGREGCYRYTGSRELKALNIPERYSERARKCIDSLNPSQCLDDWKTTYARHADRYAREAFEILPQSTRARVLHSENGCFSTENVLEPALLYRCYAAELEKQTDLSEGEREHSKTKLIQAAPFPMPPSTHTTSVV